MNLKQLVYFTTIAEEGNILAAARKLNLSQPPLSKQIQLLEEALGTPLMKRGARQIELTEAGQIFYSRAKDILSMMDSTIQEVSLLEKKEVRTLRLGCISSCGVMLTGLLQRFCQENPGVCFEVTEGNTYELLEELRSGAVECAVLRTPFREEGLVCTYGKEERLMAVGTAKFFTEAGEVLSVPELAGMPLIYYRRFEHLLSLAFLNAGQEPRVFCKNDDARTSLQWAMTGCGVALVPESISRLYAGEGMVSRPVELEATTTRMAVVYRKDRQISETVKSLAEIFREYWQ